ncbi:hypothetical protein F5Y14DRAFT_453436 [Nemania sp. NC0429]|nr:hypothetical protein F5Y14DRAFT_453436 [Nemania sp. NC0429]
MAFPNPMKGDFDDSYASEATAVPPSYSTVSAVHGFGDSKPAAAAPASIKDSSKTSQATFLGAPLTLTMRPRSRPVKMDTTPDYGDPPAIPASQAPDDAQGKRKYVTSDSGSSGGAPLKPKPANLARDCFIKRAKHTYAMVESLHAALESMEPLLLSVTKTLQQAQEQAQEHIDNAGFGAFPSRPGSSDPSRQGASSGYEGSAEKPTGPTEKPKWLERKKKTMRRPKQRLGPDGTPRPDPKNPDNFMTSCSDKSSDYDD